ncbi:hypothetical protein XA68_12145 [Ophiocordyceps unilateralis]|uniref:Uncharacterized protein n=1 Tax=Ophiocordyceps unilateralis TaxID=268505 RepID=A0A2A9PFB1_OPHUN|nr:hypothetical protein XA68_12145 [Ophiocordyceps unilateralis]
MEVNSPTPHNSSFCYIRGFDLQLPSLLSPFIWSGSTYSWHASTSISLHQSCPVRHFLSSWRSSFYKVIMFKATLLRPRVLSLVAVILFFFLFHLLHPLPQNRLSFPAAWTAEKTTTWQVARQTTASDLLGRQPPGVRPSRIPSIFHQSWKSTELPTKFQHWSATCRKTHPAWEWVIWTDDDNLRLVQKHFPSLEMSYRHLPGEIYRADLSRALYMYIFGGVYADLDMECLRPTEELQKMVAGSFNTPIKAMFGRMGDDPDFQHSIPNAWMLSTPGHPFFLHFLRTIDEQVMDIKANNKSWPDAESLTGPVALREAIAKYEEDKVRRGRRMKDRITQLVKDGPFGESDDLDHQVFLLPSSFIYPYSWGSDGEPIRGQCWVLSDGFDADKCKELLEVRQAKSICITYWSHTHTPTGHDFDNMKHIEG